MDSIQDFFWLRYRKENPTEEWKDQRDEIADFIEVCLEGVEILYNYELTHYSSYSDFIMEDEYGFKNLGPSCSLPDVLIESFPDIQFEFHFIGWQGQLKHFIEIYDGKEKYTHSLVVDAVPKSSEGDPYLIPEEWPSIQPDEDGYVKPYFYYIKDTNEEPEED